MLEKEIDELVGSVNVNTDITKANIVYLLSEIVLALQGIRDIIKGENI